MLEREREQANGKMNVPSIMEGYRWKGANGREGKEVCGTNYCNGVKFGKIFYSFWGE